MYVCMYVCMYVYMCVYVNVGNVILTACFIIFRSPFVYSSLHSNCKIINMAKLEAATSAKYHLSHLPSFNNFIFLRPFFVLPPISLLLLPAVVFFLPHFFNLTFHNGLLGSIIRKQIATLLMSVVKDRKIGICMYVCMYVLLSVFSLYIQPGNMYI